MKKIYLLLTMALLAFTVSAQDAVINESFPSELTIEDLQDLGWSFSQASISTGLRLNKKSEGGMASTPEVENPSRLVIVTKNGGTSNRSLAINYWDKDSEEWLPLHTHTVSAKVETIDVPITNQLGVTEIQLVSAGSNEFIMSSITVYGTIPVSAKAEIMSFILPGQIGSEAIDSDARTISIDMAQGSDLNLVPEYFIISLKASVSPDVTAAQDFSSPVEYTVTAEDGTTQKVWTVTVNLVLSSENEIRAFKLSDDQMGSAAINSTSGTIKIKMPNTVDISNIVPEIFTISTGATISPAIDAAQNFNNEVTYVVTAQDGTPKTWTIQTELKDPNAGNDIDFNKVVGWAASTGGPAAATNKPSTNVEIPTTTGGAGGDIVYITPATFNDLCQALYERINYKYAENKPVIFVLEPGVYDGSGVSGDATKVFSNNMLTIQEQGDVSIIGKDNVQCKFGINVKRSYNIIIRNIYFWGYKDDAVNVGEKETHHVWIDHCTAGATAINQTPSNKDAVDGTFEVKNGASYVTVSWCVTQNHWKSCLIGHSDSNGGTDTGRLKVTHYANYYHNTYSRHPRVRFGEVHVLNCMYENAGWGRDNSYKTAASLGLGYGSAASNNSQVFIEGCFFLDTQFPFYADRSASEFTSMYGLPKSSTGNKPCTGLKQINNAYNDDGLTQNLTTKVNAAVLNPSGKSIKFDELNPEAVFTPPYSYDAMDAEQVREIVPAYAGAGVLDWSILDPTRGGTSISDNNVSSDLIKVYSAQSSIVVTGAEETAVVKVFSLSGSQLYSGCTSSVSNSIPKTFEQGFYVVTVNGKGYKVLVK